MLQILKSKRPQRTPRRPQRRARGVALVMVLGIVALLLILVMSFAYDAQTTSQVAVNLDDRSQARAMARGGLERSIAFIGNELGSQTADGTSLNPGTAFYRASSGNWVGRGILATVDPTFDTGIDDAFHVAFNDYDFTPNDASTGLPSVGWSKIYSYTDGSTDGSASMDTTIVGRVAYLIIDDTGKLDASSWVDSTHDDGLAYGGTRTGLSAAELQLRDVFGVSAAAKAYHPTNHTTVALRGELPADTDWLSREMQFRSIPGNQTEADSVATLVLPFAVSDPEEYWVDVNGDSLAVASEIVDRIDLTNVGPNGAGGQVTAPMLYDAFLGVNLGNTTRDNMAYLSPWLKSKNPADMAEARRMAAQVAMNMVDWADTDADDDDGASVYQPDQGLIGLAGANYALTVSGNAAPTAPGGSYSGVVYGFEDTYYLAALGIHPVFAWAGHDLQMTPQIKTWVQRPTGNTAAPNNLRVTVGIECTIRNSLGSTFTQSTTGSVTLGSMSGAAPTYSTSNWTDLVCSPATVTFTNPTTNLHILTWGIQSFRITSVKVEVQDSPGGNWRVGQTLPAHTSGTTNTDQFAWGEVLPAANAYGATPSYYKFYEATDAGDNHRSRADSDFLSYWSRTPNNDYPHVADVSGSVSVPALYDAASSKFADATVGDTAFAGWADLGRVKAVEQGRSLRLWGNLDGLTLTEHDCYLYDMFKIGSHSTKRGRVSLNSPSTAVLNGLAGWHANTGLIDNNLPSTNGYTGGQPLMYRGDLAKRVFDISDPSRHTADQDDLAEEAFGSWMDLTTVRQNYYTIIVTAQSLKDLGAIPGPPAGALEWDTTNNKWCVIQGESKLMAFVYRDAYTGAFKVLRIDYLDD